MESVLVSPLPAADALLVPNVSVAEVLFQPGIIGASANGFRDTSLQSNMKCDVYIVKELYAMRSVRCELVNCPPTET